MQDTHLAKTIAMMIVLSLSLYLSLCFPRLFQNAKRVIVLALTDYQEGGDMMDCFPVVSFFNTDEKNESSTWARRAPIQKDSLGVQNTSKLVLYTERQY
jgi:hypothetical protein